MKSIAALDVYLLILLMLLIFPLSLIFLKYIKPVRYKSIIKLIVVSFALSIGGSSTITLFVGIYDAFHEIEDVEIGARRELKAVDQEFYETGDHLISCEYRGWGTIDDLKLGIVSYVCSANTRCDTQLNFHMFLSLAERSHVFKNMDGEILDEYCK